MSPTKARNFVHFLNDRRENYKQFTDTESESGNWSFMIQDGANPNECYIGMSARTSGSMKPFEFFQTLFVEYIGGKVIYYDEGEEDIKR